MAMNGSVSRKQRVAFNLSAPEARSVQLVGCFTDWEKSPVNLKRQKNGLWKTTVSLVPGTYQYRFLVDGQWQDDPACTAREPNAFGSENCVLTVVAMA